jgi:hypothetical protein
MARFFIRILCTLALVLAAWPAGASAAPCVKPIKPAVQKGCKMACCAKAPMAERACHQTTSQGEFKAKSDCPCEFKAAPPVVLPFEKATLSKAHLDFALPSALFEIVVAAILENGPVPFASDSSPPGDAQRRPNSPRAPPVVRV